MIRTTTGFSQIHCSCQPCFFCQNVYYRKPEIIPQPLFAATENSVELLTSEEFVVSGMTETTLFDVCSTDSKEFFGELPKHWSYVDP